MDFLSEKKLLAGDQKKTKKVPEATCDPHMAKGLSSFQALSSAANHSNILLPLPAWTNRVLGSVATIVQKDYT